jgi:hypothetical protein
MNKLIYLVALALAACGGGGGGGSSSTTQTTTGLSTCTLKTYTSTYPNSYQGSNFIPTPNNKFDTSMLRGVGVKDYYPSDNNGCATFQEHTRLLFNYTLDRLKAIGTDTVEIYPAGKVNDFSANTWTIEDINWGIPKSELIYFIQEAHKRNIKVTLIWQFIPVDMKDVWLNTNNPTEAETIKFLRGWNDIIVELAKFSATNKVDNLNVQWSAFSYPVSNYSETSTVEFVKIINNVKNVFNGKIFMGWPRFYDKRVIEKVDAIVIGLTPSNWSYIDDSNISVSLLKQRYMDAITGIYLDYSLNSGIDTKNIPIIWDFNIQSRDKALSQGWIEDGFCIDNGNNIVAFDSTSCLQKNYVTDFSVQALAIEGAFQAIKQQAYFKNYGVNFSTGYWHTDTIIASDEGFPNLSQSIRNKPAESIIKYWFKR